ARPRSELTKMIDFTARILPVMFLSGKSLIVDVNRGKTFARIFKDTRMEGKAIGRTVETEETDHARRRGDGRQR
ncbi:MAG TPA: hypothetical protein VJT74_15255, partial [Pyrinomonadaceae bacterium]|nr:hypothetical protein [Pyrinomonadaceae bacterium]